MVIKVQSLKNPFEFMWQITEFYLQQTLFLNLHIYRKLKYNGVPPPNYFWEHVKNKVKIIKLKEWSYSRHAPFRIASRLP